MTDWMKETAQDCVYWNSIRLGMQMLENGEDPLDEKAWLLRWNQLEAALGSGNTAPVRHWGWGLK